MKNDLTLRFVSAPGDALPAEQTISFQAKDIPDLTSGDLVLLSMEVKADVGVKKLDVHLYQGGVECADMYYVPAQWTRIVLCSDPAATPVGLKLGAEEGIALRSLTVTNLKKTAPESIEFTLGQFLLEDFDAVTLAEEGAGVGRTTDLVLSGNYIYSIGGGAFTVTDVTDPAAPKVCGSISGLGNTRQIALLESGTDVMVTARGYGAYIIDAADPNAPRVRCAYDSLEMATGICISGNFAYISNRQYGVEVVDVTDPDQPRFVRTISTGEVQSAQVFDGKLYCGLYGEHRVDVYDLSAEPVKLGEINLSGRGDGMCLEKSGDRTLLYAATGHHSQKKLTATTPITDPRFGQGNGLDIIDVTDPQNPRWLSTVRTDGRFYHSSYDYWEAAVSESDGHRYVHVVSTYNGLYIYNVDDPTAPVRVAHITVPIDQNSAKYSLYKSNIRTLIFPFNKYKGIQSPMGAVVCHEGVVYMAGVLTDLHILQMEQLGSQSPSRQQTVTLQQKPYEAGYPRYAAAGQVHAVISDGKQLIAACGSDGIAVLDANLNPKATYATQGICYDVQLFEGLLYSAEGRAGLACYDAATMAELWRYAPEGKVIKQVRLSPKGRFALLHSGDTEASVVRIEDLQEVYTRRTNSQMYHHNISATLVDGRYLCFWAHSTNEVWLDFGVEDDRDSPVEITEHVSRTHMAGGVVDYHGKALNVTTNGYLIYDPLEDPANLTAAGFGAGCTGKPTVWKDLLIVCNRVKGMVYLLDISSPQAPKTLQELKLPDNPDIALVAFGSIYIPCGNAGLLKLPMP